MLPIPGLSKCQAQKSLKFLGVTLECELKLHEHLKEVASKVDKVKGVIGNLDGVYNSISHQIKDLYILCARPMLKYSTPVWYHKLTGQ